jgi:hypothetical protein
MPLLGVACPCLLVVPCLGCGPLPCPGSAHSASPVGSVGGGPTGTALGPLAGSASLPPALAQDEAGELELSAALPSYRARGLWGALGDRARPSDVGVAVARYFQHACPLAAHRRPLSVQVRDGVSEAAHLPAGQPACLPRAAAVCRAPCGRHCLRDTRALVPAMCVMCCRPPSVLLLRQDLGVIAAAAVPYSVDGMMDVAAFRTFFETWLEPFLNTLEQLQMVWTMEPPKHPRMLHMVSRVRGVEGGVGGSPPPLPLVACPATPTVLLAARTSTATVRPVGIPQCRSPPFRPVEHTHPRLWDPLWPDRPRTRL